MLIIQTLTIFASLAAATSFQAWDGDECNGSAGGVVDLDTNGDCIAMGGRHSWEANGDNVKGFYYSGTGCQGQSTEFHANGEACVNINTGGAVNSLCVVGANNGGCGF